MNILDLTRGFLDISSKRGGFSTGKQDAVPTPIPAGYMAFINTTGGKYSLVSEGVMTLELKLNEVFTGSIRNIPFGALPSDNGTGNNVTFKGNNDAIAGVNLTGTVFTITGASAGKYDLDITGGDTVTKGKLTVTVINVNINPPVVNPPVTNPPVTNPPVTNPPVTNPPATTTPADVDLTADVLDARVAFLGSKRGYRGANGFAVAGDNVWPVEYDASGAKAGRSLPFPESINPLDGTNRVVTRNDSDTSDKGTYIFYFTPKGAPTDNGLNLREEVYAVNTPHYVRLSQKSSYTIKAGEKMGFFAKFDPVNIDNFILSIEDGQAHKLANAMMGTDGLIHTLLTNPNAEFYNENGIYGIWYTHPTGAQDLQIRINITSAASEDQTLNNAISTGDPNKGFDNFGFWAIPGDHLVPFHWNEKSPDTLTAQSAILTEPNAKKATLIMHSKQGVVLTPDASGKFTLPVNARDWLTDYAEKIIFTDPVKATDISTASVNQPDLVVGTTNTYKATITPANAEGYSLKIEVIDRATGNVVSPAPDWIKDNGDGTYTVLKPYLPKLNANNDSVEKLKMTLTNMDGSTVSDSSGLGEAKALGLYLSGGGNIKAGATGKVSISSLAPDVRSEGAIIRYIMSRTAPGASVDDTGKITVAAGSSPADGEVTVYVDYRGIMASASIGFSIIP